MFDPEIFGRGSWRNRIAIQALLALVFIYALTFFFSRANISWLELLEARLPFAEEEFSATTMSEFPPWPPSPGDTDQDGLDNVWEAILGSNQRRADTDGDGFSDYDEFLNFYDPAVANAPLDQQQVETRIATFLSQYQTPWQGDLRGWYYEVLGQGWREQDPAAAVKWLKIAIDYEPTLDRYWDAVFLAYTNEDLITAQELVDIYIVQYADQWEPYYQRARLLQINEELIKARADYEKALSLGAEYIWLYNNYASLLNDLGEDSQIVLSWGLKAIELDDQHPVLHENVASTYRDLGQDDLAQQHDAIAAELRARGIEL